MGDRSAPSALFTRSLIKSGSDDCDLLRACGILDASTLRGVASAEASENNNPTEEAAGEARTEQVSEEGPFADKEASPVAKDDSSAPAPVAEAECKGDSDSKVETNVEQEVSAEGSSVSLEIPVEVTKRRFAEERVWRLCPALAARSGRGFCLSDNGSVLGALPSRSAACALG